MRITSLANLTALANPSFLALIVDSQNRALTVTDGDAFAYTPLQMMQQTSGFEQQVRYQHFQPFLRRKKSIKVAAESFVYLVVLHACRHQ